MITLLVIFMILWLVGLSLAVFMIDRLLNTHEYLLYKLRDEIAIMRNKRAEGHIFCKTADRDFKCKGITLNDIKEEK